MGAHPVAVKAKGGAARTTGEVLPRGAGIWEIVSIDYTTIKGGGLRERFEAPERYAGYAVRDPQGRRIGKNLEALLVNEK